MKEKEFAYYCSEGCGYVKDDNHRCEQWCTITRIPMQALREYKEKGDDLFREPEQPIIKKSGNTWVARYDGVDYLCMKPKTWEGVAQDIEILAFLGIINGEGNNKGRWVPFSEIEITDNIALLRPMVKLRKLKNNNICELLGIKNNIAIHWQSFAMSDSSFTTDIELATVEDLEEK